MKIKLLVIFLLLFSACKQLNSRIDQQEIDERSVSPQMDDQLLRKEFNLPSELKLVHLQANPNISGMFGREGLRIFAQYEISEKQVDVILKQNPADWKNTGLPSIAQKFDQGPQELAEYKRGVYSYCKIWHRHNANIKNCLDKEFLRAFSTSSTALGYYRSAILNPAKKKLLVVFKNYY